MGKLFFGNLVGFFFCWSVFSRKDMENYLKTGKTRNEIRDYENTHTHSQKCPFFG